jgi:hypothetical protein
MYNSTVDLDSLNRIHDACRRAGKTKMISFVVGPARLGKTTAAQSYVAQNTNVLLWSNTARELTTTDTELVIIDDFLSFPFVKWKWVNHLLKERMDLGVVLVIRYDAFVSNFESIIDLASARMEQTTLRQSLGLLRDQRIPISVKGNRQLLTTSRLFQSRFVLRKHSDATVNAFYILRKPTLRDVEQLCVKHGIRRGIHHIWQQSTTIEQVINTITWKKQSQHK